MRITFAPDTENDTRAEVLRRLAGFHVTVTDTLGDRDVDVEVSDIQGGDSANFNADGLPYSEVEYAEIDTIEIL